MVNFMRRRLIKTVGLLALLVLFVLGLSITRAARLRSVQVAPGAPAPIVVDPGGAASRLAALLRLPTVSWDDPSKRETAAFDGLDQVLAESFPGVHRMLTLETVARWSRLYTWRGIRPDLPPIILTSHLDVVPVEPGTEARWTHPPFSGVIADGSIWGRGALDDKSGVAGLLEAAELLIGTGFAPARTIYFAFGHNEEGGGDASGAGQIARVLASRGVRDAWLMGEGGLIYDQVIGIHWPVALVGIAEKASMTVELVAHSEGGHASMPPAPTAVGILARAIDRLEHQQMPARLDGATRQMFEGLAPEMPFGLKLAFANLWLTKPLLLQFATSKPQTNAIVRTTTAPTMLSASPKVNVLASEAHAFVNFRLLPGDSAADIEAHVRSVVDDPRIDIRVAGRPPAQLRVAATDTPDCAALSAAVRAVYPDVIVAPYLTIAATDAREYGAVAPNTYRFLPIYQHGALEMIHGTDEHVQIDAYEKAIRVYATLIMKLAGDGRAAR